MTNIKRSAVFIILIVITTFVFSQSRNGLYKFSLPGQSSIVLTGIGPSFLFSDVGGLKDRDGLLAKSDFVLSQTKYMFSLNYRYVFQNNIGLKASALFGKFEQTDDFPAARNPRYFTFSSNLTSLALHVEYNIIGGENSDFWTPHKLYAFVGVGAMISDVNFKSLRPKREGDSHPVNNTKLVTFQDGYSFNTVFVTPTFPIGVGYEYELTPVFSIGAEFVIHASFSDYLDGISTSYSKNKDYLMNLDLTLTYKFGKSSGSRGGGRVIWN